MARLAALLDKDYVVEGQLRRQRNQNIVAAARHRLLPRVAASPRPAGPRPATRTNARTRKGPKKTVAGKKGVKDLR